MLIHCFELSGVILVEVELSSFFYLLIAKNNRFRKNTFAVKLFVPFLACHDVGQIVKQNPSRPFSHKTGKIQDLASLLKPHKSTTTV